MPVDYFELRETDPFGRDGFGGGGYGGLDGLDGVGGGEVGGGEVGGGGDLLGDVPSSMEIAQMSPEELAEYFGRGVVGFDIDEFMKRFGKFIAPFDETKIGLMEEGFQLDTGFLGARTAYGMGGIKSNMALSAGAEKQRAFVMGEYATKMGQMGLGLKSDIYGEYEKQAGERLDYFRRLAEAEVFTAEYWEDYYAPPPDEPPSEWGWTSGTTVGQTKTDEYGDTWAWTGSKWRRVSRGRDEGPRGG